MPDEVLGPIDVSTEHKDAENLLYRSENRPGEGMSCSLDIRTKFHHLINKMTIVGCHLSVFTFIH